MIQPTLKRARSVPALYRVSLLVASWLLSSCAVTDITKLGDTSISRISPSLRVDTSFVGDTIAYVMPKLFSPSCESDRLCQGVGNFDLQWTTTAPSVAAALNSITHVESGTVANLIRNDAYVRVVGVGEATVSFAPLGGITLRSGVSYTHRIIVLPSPPNMLDAPDIIVLAIGDSTLLPAAPRYNNGSAVTTGVLVWGPSSNQGVAALTPLFGLGTGEPDGQVVTSSRDPIVVRGVSQGQATIKISYKKATSDYMEHYKPLAEVNPASKAPKSPFFLEKTVLVLVGASVRVVTAPDEGPVNDPSSASTPVQVGSARQYRLIDQDHFPVSGVQWQLANAGSATLSPTGLATCVTPGTASIKGTRIGTALNASTTLTCVAVPPPPVIAVTPTSATVEVGKSASLVATVTNAIGTVDVNWSSSNAISLTVAKPGSNTATVTGVAPSANPVTVTATYVQPGTTVSAISQITVIPAVVPGYTLAAGAVSVVQGISAPTVGTIAVTRTGGFVGGIGTQVSGTPAGLTVQATSTSFTGNTLTYNVSATSAVLPGTYPVLVRGFSAVAEQQATLSVTVTAAAAGQVVAVYFDPINAEITVPAALTYRVKLLNALGNEVALSNDGGVLSYESSNVNVATIAAVSPGLAVATGVGATGPTGVTTITVRYTKNGQTVSYQTGLTVYKVAPGSDHLGAVEILTPTDRRRLAVGESMIVQVLVRDVNGVQITNSTKTIEQLGLHFPLAPNAALTITPNPPGPNPAYFYTITARSVTQATGVEVRADLIGAAASIYLIVTP
ncbi:MAG: hypothetical protein IPP90_07220 [Gemmatimonadaceae bacterium]|nr:hypothetical protein [Gemmatimonadaceae bacterium]